MFLLVIFFSDHFAEPNASRLQLWAQDFGLIVSAVMAFVMAAALMMLILAVALSAGLWIYSCARAAGARCWSQRGVHTIGLELKPHELR